MTSAAVWPRVLAHSGFQTVAAPNSLLALDLAARAGAVGLEIDVRQTRDGQFVLWHDDRFDPRIPGIVTPIDELTWADVRALNATPSDGEGILAPLGPTKIATLDEAIDLARTWDLELHLDFKQGSVPDLVETLEGADVMDRTRFESFFPDYLRQMHAIEPHLPLGLISMEPVAYDELDDLPIALASLWFLLVQEHPDQAEAALARGLRLNIWTVNEPQEWITCRDWGAHSVMTDDPAGCVAVGRLLQDSTTPVALADRVDQTEQAPALA